MQPDENTHKLEQIKQSILDAAQVGGNINVFGDITQELTINQAESPKPLSIIQNIPYRGAAKFVGREEEMSILHQLLQGTHSVKICAITGMGGIGKTELAIQYAQNHQETYPGGICWFNPQYQDIPNQIIDLARQVGLNPPNNMNDLQKVRWYWQHWQHKGNVLVIFDDVKDYKQIQQYLPPLASQFRVLLTTRKKLLTPSERLELNVLTLDTALALLESLIYKERIRAELKYAQALCKELGYLPLGLELIGRYLTRKKSLSLAEMLRLLHEKGLEQKALRKPNSESDMTAHLGVASAFYLSWQELTSEAQELACFLSIFDLVAIPWHIIEQFFKEKDSEELEDIRDDELLYLHLIQEEQDDKYKLHELIREFLHDKLVELEKDNDIQKYISVKLIKVTVSNPCCILDILKLKLLDCKFTDNVLLIPAVDLGWQLRNAIQAWIESIGQLANLVFHLQKDGTIPTLGIRIVNLLITDYRTKEPCGYMDYIQTGWYFGNCDVDDVVEFTPEIEELFADKNKDGTQIAEQLFADGWNYFQRSPFNPQTSWAWQWTLNLISNSISELLKQRKIPVNPGLLSLEAAWYAALHLTNIRSYSYYIPIPINEIEGLLTQIRTSQFSPMIQHCINQLRIEIDFFKEKGETHLSLPSSYQNFKNSQCISPELLLKYTEEVFQGAIKGYLQIVNRYFSKFVPSLQFASLFPARLVGVVVSSPSTVSATWFWEPLRIGSESYAEFKISDNFVFQDDARFKLAVNQIRSLRPNSFKYPLLKSQSESPLSHSWLGSNPVTELVYQWLWEDLKNIFSLERELSRAGFPYWR